MGAAVPAATPAIVLSSLALKGILERFRTRFERSVGPLELRFDATQALLPLVRAGKQADLLILTAEAMEQLRASGTVTRTWPLGSSGVGVAVRAGEPRPDIGSVEALKSALLAARSVAHSKVGASGIYFSELLERWETSRIGVLRQYVRMFTSLVVFAENELPPGAVAV